MQTTDVAGNVNQASYDRRGRIAWSEDETGAPTDYAYDDTTDLLLTVTGPDPDGAGSLGRPVTTNRYDEIKIGTSGTPGTALSGFQASYYSNTSLAGRPVKRQNDTAADFTWASGTGPSALGTQTDNFSVRWTGLLKPAQTGTYNFLTAIGADESSRLTLGDQQVIANWSTDSVRSPLSEALSLTAGTTYAVTFDYQEGTGDAQASLRWICEDCSTPLNEAISGSVIKPNWANQTSTVDPLGNVAFHHFADPALVQADYDQQVISSTNVVTAYTYDALGRMTQKVMPKGNSSRSIDSNGNLGGSSDTTYATTWTYYTLTETTSIPSTCGSGTSVMQFGQLKSLQHAALTATSTIYDAAGRAICGTNAAGSTKSTFDADGRLATVRAPGESQDTTYTYDPAGQALSVADASGTVSSEYDERGEQVRGIDSYGAEATFRYDAEGNRTRVVAAKGALSSNTNYTTTYAYDDAGQMTSLTDPASAVFGFTYDTRGNLKTVQYPNGTYSWRDYNAGGWLTALYNRHGTLSVPPPSSVPSDASPISDYAYTYNVGAQRTQDVRSGAGFSSETQSYTYDSLGRMATVTLPNATVRTYAFDLDSNRTSITEQPSGGAPSVVATYTYSTVLTPGLDELSNVVVGLNTTSFNYDKEHQSWAKVINVRGAVRSIAELSGVDGRSATRAQRIRAPERAIARPARILW